VERTLAELAASGAPLAERVAAVRALACAVAALHARGRVHGALRPAHVLVLDGGGVALAPPGAARDPFAGAGWDAPEVARGAKATRRSDAFSLGALAFLALAGRGPFDADDPLERLRASLHDEPDPVRRHAPALPAALDGAIAALLEKSPRRRGGPEALVLALDGGNGAPAPRAAPRRGAREALRASLPTFLAAGAAARQGLGRLARAPALRAPGARRRVALAAAALLALGLLLPRGDAALEREIAALVERGDLPAARRRLEALARERPGDPLVEKLRGDVACARGAPGECLRRYRVALAARPALRSDAPLRANARRLLAREQACGTRRAAANLLGELRDPEALPALEAARRAGGFFAFFCTGDALDRAITATRAEVAR
jgi:hypothetical protein